MKIGDYMKYLVKVGSLKQKIEFLGQQLAIIDDRIKELEQVKLTIKWEGDAATTFIEVYDNYLYGIIDFYPFFK